MGQPAKKFRLFKKSSEDVLADSSSRGGMGGILESFIRKFRNASFLLLMLPLAALCISVLGFSVAPGIFVFAKINAYTMDWPEFARYFALGCGVALAYLTYGLTLIFAAPAANFLIPFKVREWRGIWFSLPAISWYFHNALTYIVRYTFLELITPTPLTILFYRMMGMKIGKGVVINTTNISDPAMIEIGDYVTIGGSAHILAHYGQKGYLVISKVKIGNGTTIGLKASVMGGAQIGERCVIRPHTAVLPKTVIADDQTV